MMSASVTLPLCSCSWIPASATTRLHVSSSANSILSMKAEMGSTIRIRRTKPFTCNAFFGLGVPELVVIAGVSAVVFGPKNLPQLGRSIGKTLKSFQQAAKEFESELKKEPNSTDETPAEKLTAVTEQQDQDSKVSSAKDSV